MKKWCIIIMFTLFTLASSNVYLVDTNEKKSIAQTRTQNSVKSGQNNDKKETFSEHKDSPENNKDRRLNNDYSDGVNSKQKDILNNRIIIMQRINNGLHGLEKSKKFSKDKKKHVEIDEENIGSKIEKKNLNNSPGEDYFDKDDNSKDKLFRQKAKLPGSNIRNMDNGEDYNINKTFSAEQLDSIKNLLNNRKSQDYNDKNNSNGSASEDLNIGGVIPNVTVNTPGVATRGGAIPNFTLEAQDNSDGSKPSLVVGPPNVLVGVNPEDINIQRSEGPFGIAYSPPSDYVDSPGNDSTPSSGANTEDGGYTGEDGDNGQSPSPSSNGNSEISNVPTPKVNDEYTGEDGNTGSSPIQGSNDSSVSSNVPKSENNGAYTGEDDNTGSSPPPGSNESSVSSNDSKPENNGEYTGESGNTGSSLPPGSNESSVSSNDPKPENNGEYTGEDDNTGQSPPPGSNESSVSSNDPKPENNGEYTGESGNTGQSPPPGSNESSVSSNDPKPENNGEYTGESGNTGQSTPPGSNSDPSNAPVAKSVDGEYIGEDGSMKKPPPTNSNSSTDPTKASIGNRNVGKYTGEGSHTTDSNNSPEIPKFIVDQSLQIPDRLEGGNNSAENETDSLDEDNLEGSAPPEVKAQWDNSTTIGNKSINSNKNETDDPDDDLEGSVSPSIETPENNITTANNSNSKDSKLEELRNNIKRKKNAVKKKNCHENAKVDDLGECSCKPGFAGSGTMCGMDSDSDGFPDQDLDCKEKECKKDNCVNIVNGDQLDSDDDGIGDECDSDADNDSIPDDKDNCPLKANKDQKDSDGDKTGDVCDKCPNDKDDQHDLDNDGIGDVCDEDRDGDGIKNQKDNCPELNNPDQKDVDGDKVGDICDNCVKIANPNQEDDNLNLIGNVCDSRKDKDSDGIPDTVDNCIDTVNSDQVDTDDDGIGDECDPDIDNDGIPNNNDSCIFVPNKENEEPCKQLNDEDGDGKKDLADICPLNKKIDDVDFRDMTTTSLTPKSEQKDPKWIFTNNGRDIQQEANSRPGVGVTSTRLVDLDFQGIFFVGKNDDNDYAGMTFSYQDSSNFYIFYSSKAGSKQGPWMIMRVNSATGPSNKLELALWDSAKGSIKNQTTLIWQNKDKSSGWEVDTPYQFKIIHRPRFGLIRAWVYNGSNLIVDSGNVFDESENPLRGGRIGVFCLSQEKVKWSNMKYECKSTVAKEVWDDLPNNIQGQLTPE